MQVAVGTGLSAGYSREQRRDLQFHRTGLVGGLVSEQMKRISDDALEKTGWSDSDGVSERASEQMTFELRPEEREEATSGGRASQALRRELTCGGAEGRAEWLEASE